MTIEIPINNKFAVIALPHVLNVSGQVLFPLRFDGQLWALSHLPFEIDDGWRRWLGLRADTFGDSNLFLLATAPSQSPAGMDNEDKALERAARFLYIALGIQGLHTDHAGLIIQGARLPEPRGFDVQSISDTSRIFRLKGIPSVPFSASSLVRAAQMAANIGKLVDRKKQPRLLKGLRSLISGLATEHGEERLHAFVRALDAVVKLPKGKGNNVFATRCGTFAGRKDNVRKILLELYLLRNAAEHVNDFRTVFADLIEPEIERIVLQRVLQAEVLASSVYIRILSSDYMTASFANDEGLDELWSRTYDELDAFWGGSIDLEKLPEPPMKF